VSPLANTKLRAMKSLSVRCADADDRARKARAVEISRMIPIYAEAV